jgi:hypothetical protein
MNVSNSLPALCETGRYGAGFSRCCKTVTPHPQGKWQRKHGAFYAGFWVIFWVVARSIEFQLGIFERKQTKNIDSPIAFWSGDRERVVPFIQLSNAILGGSQRHRIPAMCF